MKIEDVVNRDPITRLRQLIKEYGSYTFQGIDIRLIGLDDTLRVFNSIMDMETFSLADDVRSAVSRQDLQAYEKFKKTFLSKTGQTLSHAILTYPPFIVF